MSKELGQYLERHTPERIYICGFIGSRKGLGKDNLRCGPWEIVFGCRRSVVHGVAVIFLDGRKTKVAEEHAAVIGNQYIVLKFGSEAIARRQAI